MSGPDFFSVFSDAYVRQLLSEEDFERFDSALVAYWETGPDLRVENFLVGFFAFLSGLEDGFPPTFLALLGTLFIVEEPEYNAVLLPAPEAKLEDAMYRVMLLAAAMNVLVPNGQNPAGIRVGCSSFRDECRALLAKLRSGKLPQEYFAPVVGWFFYTARAFWIEHGVEEVPFTSFTQPPSYCYRISPFKFEEGIEYLYYFDALKYELVDEWGEREGKRKK